MTDEFLRDADAHLRRGREHADRDHDVGSEHGCGPWLDGEQNGCRGRPGIGGVVGRGHDELLIGCDPGCGERALVPARRRAAVSVGGVRDVTDPPVAEREEMLGRQLPARLVVDGHRRFDAGDSPVQEDRRNARGERPDHVLVAHLAGALEQEAVDPALRGEAAERLRGVGLHLRVGEQERQAALAGARAARP